MRISFEAHLGGSAGHAGMEALPAQRDRRWPSTASEAFTLGLAYSCGSEGLPLDMVEAHRWLNVAASRGYAPARAVRAEIAALLDASEMMEALRLARATELRPHGALRPVAGHA